VLADQVAVVTGASSGIGKAVALGLAAAGASVVVNYASDSAAAVEVVRRIESLGGRAIAVPADVAKEAQVQDLFRIAIKTFGTVHILVNNAGLQRDAPLVDMTLDQWNTVLSVNLTGQFL
jgi:glucose 1-dehydrogenase